MDGSRFLRRVSKRLGKDPSVSPFIRQQLIPLVVSTVLAGCGKSHPAAFSHRSEAQRSAWANACSHRRWVGRVKASYGSPLRHRALTDSRPSANVRLIILRVADLAEALLDGLFAHPAWLFSVPSHLDIHHGYRDQTEFFRSLLRVGASVASSDQATLLN